jgi:hypothetical protein
MKCLLILLFIITSFNSFSQTSSLKHPRVAELEDKMVKEGSTYFSRRYPNEPFFIKVEIQPLRRISSTKKELEDLPYHDGESEEIVDEWDDPTTTLSYLRNRITKTLVEVSVPQDFDEQKIADLKQEISVFLRLVPYRDDVKVEKKFKVVSPEVPVYVYSLIAGLFVCIILFGLMMKWSFKSIKLNSSADSSNAISTGAQQINAAQTGAVNARSDSHQDVSGDVTVHDPLKTLDIVHIKLNQIEQSHTFPTFNDYIHLDELCKNDPGKLGALIFEFSQESQKILFKMGSGTRWLEAFASPSRIDQACLNALDKMTRRRELLSPDKSTEELLIQSFRLGDKAVMFFKSIEDSHAFILLNYLPKSFSLKVAKKAFPGAWGKLLENQNSNVVIDTKLIAVYLKKALEIESWMEPRMLDGYKKDREILAYLDNATIEDEKDIYETLSEDSFILKVRPAFFKVFELAPQEFLQVVSQFPLDKWGLVPMNSSRNYLKMVIECLDDKQKMVLSTHLKRYDSKGFSSTEKNLWVKSISTFAHQFVEKSRTKDHSNLTREGEAGDSHKQTA